MVCILLNSWDGKREWTVDLPENEDICGLAVTADWIAVATSMRFIRLFTLGGIQREIVSIPGPIVAINGSRNRLVVVHHYGTRMYILNYSAQYVLIYLNYLILIFSYPQRTKFEILCVQS